MTYIPSTSDAVPMVVPARTTLTPTIGSAVFSSVIFPEIFPVVPARRNVEKDAVLRRKCDQFFHSKTPLIKVVQRDSKDDAESTK
jgi:hypothetical protein